jgi:hypothetical protein
MQPHWPQWLATLAAVPLLAGCGANGSQAVAHLSPSSTSASRSRTAPASGERSPVAYATCMRSHGVINFPHPTAAGAFSTGNLDPNSPQFRAASQACRSFQPAGTTFSTGSSGAVSPRPQAQLLAFARCMRSHGVPSFTDPTGHGLALPAGIDPNSPAFQAATQACRRLLPGFGQAGMVTVRPGAAHDCARWLRPGRLRLSDPATDPRSLPA